MADVIDLRQARKAKARAGKEAEARENRIRFGRTGAEKRRDADEKSRGTRAHEGRRIDDDRDPDGSAV